MQEFESLEDFIDYSEDLVKIPNGFHVVKDFVHLTELDTVLAHIEAGETVYVADKTGSSGRGGSDIDAIVFVGEIIWSSGGFTEDKDCGGANIVGEVPTGTLIGNVYVN